MPDNDQFKKRIIELSARFERTGVPQSTKFLTVAEQSELLSLKLPCELVGGYDGAERRIAVFGEAEEEQLSVVRIFPASKKFADELTHRDFLGSLMALGINREVLGDIIVKDGEGYLICLSSIADYIIENITEIKRSTVRAEYSELPDEIEAGGEERSVVVASERLDALISAVWKLSREDAKAMVEKGLVYVDSRLMLKAGAQLDEGAVVSVRGKGRFTYLGLERETKKGKMRVTVRVN